MRILFIGDIVGKKGRWALSQFLEDFVTENEVEFVIANVENAAGGYGITDNISKKVRSYGVHVQTSGNHIWDRPQLRPYLDKMDHILRPANYPVGMPGRGGGVYQLDDGRKIGVLNIEGRDYLSRIDCPFRIAEAELTLMRRETQTIFVDFHAELPQEKAAMAFHLDGRVSMLVGTHTHIQTADEKILPKGTGFITDVGMTGAYDSVIGMKKKAAIGRFISGIPHKFSVAEDDPRVAGVMIDIDDDGRTTAIKRIFEKISEGNYDPNQKDQED
ncbi:MAG: metallophosphoesterase [candidate division Zixibacteria bacterium]|nr:metallophosphoesterase [candidate division Zixibacteria bacterium]